jgi:hypothetical protein
MRERDHLEDPGIDGRILLRCIFRKEIEVPFATNLSFVMTLMAN